MQYVEVARQRRSASVIARISLFLIGLSGFPLAAFAANFTVGPTAIDFGTEALGATATVNVTITNTSGSVQTPSFSGGGPSDAVNFGGSQNCAAKTFQPGDSCVFAYVFHPTSTGPQSAATGIGIGNDSYPITLAGTGVAAFSVTPTTLDFGTEAVGATDTIDVTVTNTSGAVQTPGVSGGGPSDSANFGGSQSCAGRTFQPGESCTFTYMFHPAATGRQSATTGIGIGGAFYALSLSGVGVSAFSVGPTTLDFGNAAVNSTATINLTVTNTSNAVQTPSFSGGGPADSTNFGGSQSCAGRTFQPGDTCTFTYIFHPTTSGGKSTTAGIGIGADFYPIAFSGTGIDAAAGSRNFSVSPTTLNFGSTAVGATGTIDVTVTNTSGEVQTPGFSGGGPSDSGNFGGTQACAGRTLQPNGSCTFTYTFHPTSEGAKSATTGIGIGDDNFALTLSGTGVPAFSVGPTTLDFGTEPVGATGTINITVTNISGAVQKPGFSGGGPSDSVNFGGTQGCAGRTFQPGDSCTFTYTFHPATTGAKSAATGIGIGNDSYPIVLSGTGILAFSVAPTTLNFGGTAIGSTQTIGVTVTNTSGAVQTPSFSGGGPSDSVNFGGTQGCAGRTFEPGDTCTFTYTFHPIATGAKSATTGIGIGNEGYALALSGFGTSTQSYPVGGTVTGLAGSGLVLALDVGGQTLTVGVNGSFTFPSPVADGASYNVTITTQPAGPQQTCTVANGSGVISDAAVANLAVTCVTSGFTVGGTVTGLSGSGLTLGLNNGSQTLAISTSGSFTFPSALNDASTYTVAVLKQPGSPHQSCTVTNGGGAINSANVSNIVVTCGTALNQTTTILLLAPNPAHVSEAVIATVSASAQTLPTAASTPAALALAPTGAVAVSAGGSSCTTTLASGAGSCVLSFAAAGSYEVTATYLGDANNAPSSVSTALVVLAAIPTAAVSAPTLSAVGYGLLILVVLVMAFGRFRRTLRCSPGSEN